MDNINRDVVAVKAALDCECKRFGISTNTTFQNLVDTLSNLFACKISQIQYRDEDDDLVCIGSREEFLVALRSVPKTGGILRLVLSASLDQGNDGYTELKSDSVETDVTASVEISTSVDVSDVSIQNADLDCKGVNLMEPEGEPQVHETMEVSMDNKEPKYNSGEPRKNSIRNKIESASKLSKDLSAEVRGCIPVLPPSVCGLDTHFTSQNPLSRKVRRISSGTASGGADKNDKKQGRGRPMQQKKKRKHRESSSSSSESSTSRSSSSSSSSSSASSCEDNYNYYKKSKKKKRKSSPTVKIEKIFHKCEKQITAKVAKDMDKYTKKFKDDIVSSVTSSILQKLDGAVLQSFVVPNGVTPPTSEPSGASTSMKPGEAAPAKRMRYQHQNVVCDHCENEIFGPRFKCGNCSDYDLCERCEAIEGVHTPSHVFVKMHYPAALVGRRSIGGKSKPLLRANIYEERENEREMEDLLQRKLDSGSELNQKVMENFENKRKKLKEVEQAKEACAARKEEWKRMKKEVKKNKKDLTKKIKQQGKIMQRNIKRSAIAHKDEGFCFDDYIHKSDHNVVKEPIMKEKIEVKAKMQDEKLSSALSGLQIIQGEIPASVDQVNTDNNTIGINDIVEDITDGNASASNDTMIDLTTDSDDVIVVQKYSAELNAANHAAEPLQKPDLVDFQRQVSPCTSEDFVVVSNYFDLAVPLDDKYVHEHRNCESCQNLSTYDPEMCAGSNELPMDLVASVPVTSRNQPDIASVSTVNIMDESIEKFSSVSSSPPISPERIDSIQSDAGTQDVPEVIQACIITQPSGMSSENVIINEPVPIQTEAILIPSEPSQEAACNQENELPHLEEERSGNSQETVRTTCQKIDVDVSSPVLCTQNDKSTQHEAVDMTNPIVISQVEQENCILNSLSQNSFEAARTEICNLRDEAIEDSTIPEAAEESTIPNEDTSTDQSGSNTEHDGGTFTGALVGAMANIVDTVAHVVQTAKGTPRAEYRNNQVEVKLPTDLRAAGMQKLLDMGFFDRPVNERLLERYNDDVGRCVADLLAIGDNQWHQTRH